VVSANLNFQTLTEGLSTKSEKIRALGRAGASTGDIARYLGIRYQHARNVLADAGLLGERLKAEAADAEASRRVDPEADHLWARLAADGTLTVPARFLARAGLAKGQLAHVRLTDDGVEILSQAAALRRAQQIVRKYVPEGVSLADELIAERRAEAERESKSH
jgi:hypothetical protein